MAESASQTSRRMAILKVNTTCRFRAIGCQHPRISFLTRLGKRLSASEGDSRGSALSVEVWRDRDDQTGRGDRDAIGYRNRIGAAGRIPGGIVEARPGCGDQRSDRRQEKEAQHPPKEGGPDKQRQGRGRTGP